MAGSPAQSAGRLQEVCPSWGGQARAEFHDKLAPCTTCRGLPAPGQHPAWALCRGLKKEQRRQDGRAISGTQSKKMKCSGGQRPFKGLFILCQRGVSDWEETDLSKLDGWLGRQPGWSATWEETDPAV